MTADDVPPHAPVARPPEAANPVEAVNEYLTALYTADFDRARAVVADDFDFVGPFLVITGRDGFFDGAAGLLQVVRGHRLIRQWNDAEEVCSIHDVHLASATRTETVTMSEWHTLRSGQLVAGRVFFDSAPFRAFLQSG